MSAPPPAAPRQGRGGVGWSWEALGGQRSPPIPSLPPLPVASGRLGRAQEQPNAVRGVLPPGEGKGPCRPLPPPCSTGGGRMEERGLQRARVCLGSPGPGVGREPCRGTPRPVWLSVFPPAPPRGRLGTRRQRSVAPGLRGGAERQLGCLRVLASRSRSPFLLPGTREGPESAVLGARGLHHLLLTDRKREGEKWKPGTLRFERKRQKDTSGQQ